jgi:MarR family transcriptional regulator, transcriptional regulator for hemolysin
MIDESRHVLDPEERFENALRNTAMAWQQAVDRRLRRLGVNRMGWMTIAAATQATSPLSQIGLADRLGVSPASMGRTIDRLVKDGLVKREPSATDRRLNRVVVTDAGMHFYLLKKDEVAAGLREMLAGVEPEELMHLIESLEKLHIRRQVPGPPAH